MSSKIEAFMELVDERGLRNQSDLTAIRAESGAHNLMVGAFAETLQAQQDQGVPLPDVVVGVCGRTNRVATDIAQEIGKGFVGFYSTGKSPKELKLTTPSAAYIEQRAASDKLNVLIVDDVAAEGASVGTLVDELMEIAPDAKLRALYLLGDVSHLDIAGIEVTSVEEMAKATA